MIYFVSGHRDLTKEEFNKIYIPKINEVLEKDPNAEFIVGDCEGVDKFAMDYIYNKCVPLYIGFVKKIGLRNVPLGAAKLNEEILDDPRDFNTEYLGEFDSDIDRDEYFTSISDFDIAYVKDGRWNSGTAQNIKRRYGI